MSTLRVVGEGLNLFGTETAADGFGHAVYGEAQHPAAQVIACHLNQVGLPSRGLARYNIPGTGQRSHPGMASQVDRLEAQMHGRNALEIALHSGSGYMSTLKRTGAVDYEVVYGQVPLEDVANTERRFPLHWLVPSRTDVTDEFFRYARPLIGDASPEVPQVDSLQRFAARLCAGPVACLYPGKIPF